MYTPSHYKNENLDEVREFLKQNSFGILINQTDGRPWATHIPLELDVDDVGSNIQASSIRHHNLHSES